jgi:hypothetical protein
MSVVPELPRFLLKMGKRSRQPPDETILEHEIVYLG